MNQNISTLVRFDDANLRGDRNILALIQFAGATLHGEANARGLHVSEGGSSGHSSPTHPVSFTWHLQGNDLKKWIRIEASGTGDAEDPSLKVKVLSEAREGQPFLYDESQLRNQIHSEVEILFAKQS